MRTKPFFLCLLLTTSLAATAPPQEYKVSSGSIAFRSDAPLELIKAESSDLKGLISPEKKHLPL